MTFWYRNFSVSRLANFFPRVSVSVSGNLNSEKSFGFKKFGLGKKSRFQKIWSRKQSLGFGFGELGVRKKSRGVLGGWGGDKEMEKVFLERFTDHEKN